MWGKKSVAVIFPTYREKKSIYKAILDFNSSGFVDEIIVVDNNAEKGTEEEVKRTKAKIIKETDQGVGRAIRTGINYAKADLIIISEPDGTFEGKDVSKLLSYSDDFDMVFGTRTHIPLINKKSGMSMPRRLFDYIFARMINLLFSCSRLTDVGCIMRLTNRKGWQQIVNECKSDDALFITEWQLIAAKNKVKFIEAPLNFRKRVGKSQITATFKDQAKWAIKIFFYIWKVWFFSVFKKKNKKNKR